VQGFTNLNPVKQAVRSHKTTGSGKEKGNVNFYFELFKEPKNQGFL
jgi:hypothetical protein